MKLLGRVLIGLLALSIITRIIAGPCFGFNLISMVGFICLLYHLLFGFIIYYPGSTFFTIEENQAKSIIGYRVLAIFKGVLVAVIIYTYSGIFSLNPYSFGMTAFIVPLTLIYLLLELVLSKFQRIKLILKRNLLAIVAALALWFTPHESFINLNYQAAELRDAYEQWLKNPENEELYYKRIQLEKELYDCE